MLLARPLTDEELRELLADRPPSGPRVPSEIHPMRCPLDPNTWAPSGSYNAGRCLCCFVPFPEDG